jgi:hypothetical protein
LYFVDALSGAALAITTAVAAALFAGVLLLRLAISRHAHRHIPARFGLLVRRFALTASVNATLYSVLSTVDVLLGSMLVSPASIAPLGLAARGVAAVANVQSAVLELHAPVLARAIRLRQWIDTRAVSRRIARESAALTMAGAVLLLSALYFIGPRAPATFSQALIPLAILLGAQVAKAMFAQGPYFLTLTGSHLRLAVHTVIGTAVSASLVLALAGSFGATGLAIGSAVGLVVYVAGCRLSMHQVIRGGGLRNEAVYARS